jgi:hypothetical protein
MPKVKPLYASIIYGGKEYKPGEEMPDIPIEVLKLWQKEKIKFDPPVKDDDKQQNETKPKTADIK